MILNIIIIVLAIAVDQVSKYLSAAYLSGTDTLPVIENILHFTYVENRGAAFGMLSEHRWVFMLLSVVGIAALVFWLIKTKPQSRLINVAVALIIGGGIGNMIDRIFRGYVIDFIDCRFINFYVFNIADSCVCVGCALAMLGLIIEIVNEERVKKAHGGDADNADNTSNG